MRKVFRKALAFLLTGAITASMAVPGKLIASASETGPLPPLTDGSPSSQTTTKYFFPYINPDITIKKFEHVNADYTITVTVSVKAKKSVLSGHSFMEYFSSNFTLKNGSIIHPANTDINFKDKQNLIEWEMPYYDWRELMFDNDEVTLTLSYTLYIKDSAPNGNVYLDPRENGHPSHAKSYMQYGLLGGDHLHYGEKLYVCKNAGGGQVEILSYLVDQNGHYINPATGAPLADQSDPAQALIGSNTVNASLGQDYVFQFSDAGINGSYTQYGAVIYPSDKKPGVYCKPVVKVLFTKDVAVPVTYAFSDKGTESKDPIPAKVGDSYDTLGSSQLLTATVTNYANLGAFVAGKQLSDAGIIGPAPEDVVVRFIRPAVKDHTIYVNEDEDKSFYIGDLAREDGGYELTASSFTFTVDSSNGSVITVGDHFVLRPAVNCDKNFDIPFTVSDGHGGVNSGTLHVEMKPVNDAPEAPDYDVTTPEDTPYSGKVKGTDIDSKNLSYSVASGPAHGNLNFNDDGTYTYTPDANYYGGDSFTYKVSDGEASAEGTVNITVVSVNDKPIAPDYDVSTPEDTPYSGKVAATDIDSDGLTYAPASQPQHGRLSFNADGSFTYTPDADFNGNDGFTYTSSDGELTDEGTVTITVAPVNDAPTASDATLQTEQGTAVSGTLKGADIDGTIVSFAIGTPLHGRISNFDAANGSFTYTPDADFYGTDKFTFTVTDNGINGTGALTSAPATITISVTKVETIPENPTPESPSPGTTMPDDGTPAGGNPHTGGSATPVLIAALMSGALALATLSFRRVIRRRDNAK